MRPKAPTDPKQPLWIKGGMSAPSTAPYALVVDDDALLRMDVVDILTDAGFRTFEAQDGDKAIKAA